MSKRPDIECGTIDARIDTLATLVEHAGKLPLAKLESLRDAAVFYREEQIAPRNVVRVVGLPKGSAESFEEARRDAALQACLKELEQFDADDMEVIVPYLRRHNERTGERAAWGGRL